MTMSTTSAGGRSSANHRFLCPISKGHTASGLQWYSPPFWCSDIMKDPVTTVAGNAYERTEIEKWFAEGKSTDPVSGQTLEDLRLTTCFPLRNLIEESQNEKSTRQQIKQHTGEAMQAETAEEAGAALTMLLTLVRKDSAPLSRKQLTKLQTTLQTEDLLETTTVKQVFNDLQHVCDQLVQGWKQKLDRARWSAEIAETMKTQRLKDIEEKQRQLRHLESKLEHLKEDLQIAKAVPASITKVASEYQQEAARLCGTIRAYDTAFDVDDTCSAAKRPALGAGPPDPGCTEDGDKVMVDALKFVGKCPVQMQLHAEMAAAMGSECAEALCLQHGGYLPYVIHRASCLCSTSRVHLCINANASHASQLTSHADAIPPSGGLV